MWSGHNILCNFSYSCGYRKAFEEYTIILQKKYPEISVEGGNYEPPGFSMPFAKFLVSFTILLLIKNTKFLNDKKFSESCCFGV